MPSSFRTLTSLNDTKGWGEAISVRRGISLAVSPRCKYSEMKNKRYRKREEILFFPLLKGYIVHDAKQQPSQQIPPIRWQRGGCFRSMLFARSNRKSEICLKFELMLLYRKFDGTEAAPLIILIIEDVCRWNGTSSASESERVMWQLRYIDEGNRRNPVVASLVGHI